MMIQAYIGKPYIYGGNNLLDGGVDCSGFILELLRSIGLWGPEDATAQGIYDVVRLKGWPVAERSGELAGSLLFFGDGIAPISHVALAVSDTIMVEAGGGRSTTVNLDAARAAKAMVRFRSIQSRAKDIITARRLPGV